MYREEAIDALTSAMNCQTCSEKIQEKSARALLMLGGLFPSYIEEATSEKWLLKLAGFNEHSDDSFYGKDENLVCFFLSFDFRHLFQLISLFHKIQIKMFRTKRKRQQKFGNKRQRWPCSRVEAKASWQHLQIVW